MHPLRKLAFAGLATLLVLGAVEGMARLTESRWSAPPRRIPAPAPEIRGGDPFQQMLSEARKQAGLPDMACTPLPLWRDAERGWTLPPNATVETPAGFFHGNSLGLRGPELTPKPAGTLRILTLGDSSVFGDCVSDDDVLSTVAARKLALDLGNPVDAVIGAAPGHDSGQSRVTLEKLGTLVAPDLVVIGSLWSDVYRRDLLPWLEEGAFAEPASLRSLRHAATWRLGRHLLAPFLRTRAVGYLSSPDDVTGDPRVALASYRENLDTMASTAESLGARPIFLVLPAPMDLDPAPVPASVADYRAAMAWVAQKHRAPLVDGPSLFREKGATILWFADRVHPAAEGHRVLGEAIAQAIATTSSTATPPTGSDP